MRRLDEGSSNAATDCEKSDLEHDRDRRIAVLCVGQAHVRIGKADGAVWFCAMDSCGEQWARARRVMKANDADD